MLVAVCALYVAPASAATTPVYSYNLLRGNAGGDTVSPIAGDYQVILGGTYNGATLTLYETTNGLVNTVAAYTSTPATTPCITIPAGANMQMVVTGGPPSGMTAILGGVGVGGCGNGGSGDVTGPGSSTSGNFPSFADTSGVVLQDSTYGPTSFSPAGVVSIVTTSQTIHASDVASCKHYIVNTSSLTFTVDATSGLTANGCIEIETLGNSATLTANAADTITYAGTTSGAGGSATLPTYSLFRINTDAAGKLFVSGRSTQGIGAKTATATGSFVSGNLTMTDANGTIVDSGVAPGAAAPFANNWVANNWYSVSRGTVAAGANVGTTTTYWQSRYFDKALTISQVHIRVSTLSAGQNMAIAIYAADASTGLPTGSAICSINTLSTASATDVTGNCSAALTAGKFYWFGFQASDTTAIAISFSNGQVNSTAFENGTSGANVSGNTTSAFMAYTTTGGTFGTWPSNPTITQTAITTALMPFIEFKVASIP